jgi:hypothetical protein
MRIVSKFLYAAAPQLTKITKILNVIIVSNAVLAIFQYQINIYRPTQISCKPRCHFKIGNQNNKQPLVRNLQVVMTKETSEHLCTSNSQFPSHLGKTLHTFAAVGDKCH